jgi:protein tyrosine/serine phosphatase
MTPADLELLRSLGVATVIDLRSPVEVERTVSALRADPSIRYVNTSVLSNDGLMERREESTFDEGYLARRYLHYLDVGGDAFMRAFAEMAVSENYPLVFNCFLGKDRTGVLAALVLSCLGVQRDEIIEDYALTSTRVPFIVEKLRSDPVYRDTIDRTDPIVLDANALTMTNFLEQIEQRYSGARNWALGAGVASGQLDRMSELLLE